MWFFRHEAQQEAKTNSIHLILTPYISFVHDNIKIFERKMNKTNLTSKFKYQFRLRIF